MLKTLTPRRRKEINIGPNDDGRRMSLADFDRATGEKGYTYELNQGTIEVTNIPHRRHYFQLSTIRDELSAYKVANPKIIKGIGGGSGTKILIESEKSERHPDIAVYFSPMPDVDEIWSIWIPTIAFEIVSKRSFQTRL